MTVLEVIGLFLTGLLAGAEFVVRYGVQPALDRLPDHSRLIARQAIIKTLRVLVPAIMIPAVLAGVAVLVFVGGSVFRWAGVAALVAFLLLAFLGTVPINIKVDSWNPDAPPADWEAVIKRWALIDIFRSSAAILAFVFFLVAAALG